jgi:hypothetical protein
MMTWLYAFALQAAAVLALVYLVAIIGARLCGPAVRRPSSTATDAK